jgi:hypothetical protein
MISLRATSAEDRAERKAYPEGHGESGVVQEVLHGLLEVVDLGTVPRQEVPPIVDVALGLGSGTVVAMDLRSH